ncbi:hypothetical protein C8F04DRAFT_1233075 [Mycena alexandri]|uniref:DUF6534 domain-containing protein n=1 Tax=Mycena alexandri TaxID=1745969 RepID=A0AAD6SYV7_9AGAR|nr:hypothetical protein C8F04DRAFT_1233075 [Mycena alexandri]
MHPQHSLPPPPSFDADSTLGALLIGVLVSYMLFGVTTTQTYIYNGRFPNDSRRMKALVACVWFCELAHAICIAHMLYVLLISRYGHPESLTNIPKSLVASILFNAIVAVCVQGFFSYRIYRLWKKLYVPLLAWTLSFLFLGATGVVFVIGLQSLPYQIFEEQWGWLLDSLWGVAAANDLIIAGTLVFWLLGRRGGSAEFGDRSVDLVDKIIAWSIETGVVTSAAAILNLACFVTMKNNYIWIAWYVVTARLYSNSFLASLNSRATLRMMNEMSPSLPYPIHSSVNTEAPDLAFLDEMRMSSMRTSFQSSAGPKAM